MVTAVGNRAIIEEAYQLGANDYITKPLSLAYLETSVSEKIANLMKSSQGQTKNTPLRNDTQWPKDSS
jgi:response regulator RpfG family c-di-GMP phosphodiesterase